MIVPTVHLNGTSKDELLRQVRNADSWICRAMEALREAYPNGRDYYPQGPGALKQATEEHRARIDRLVDIRTELLALEAAIEEQGR